MTSSKDRIVDGKRIRQITLATGIGSYNLDLYANYETTLYEVNISFFSYLSLPSGWYKGNTHVHAKKNPTQHQPLTPYRVAYGEDGCDEEDEDKRGYAEKGFDFIYVTAHNKLEGGTGQNDKCGYTFKLFKGEEVGLTGQNPPDPHISSLNITSEITPATGGTRLSRYIANCDEADSQETYNHPVESVLNHPSYDRVSNNVLTEEPTVWHLEIHNGKTPNSNSEYKERWKEALNADRYYSGVAADDAHIYSDIGKAWIVVKASSLDNNTITQVLWDAYDDPTLYYASTGIVIEDYIYYYSPKKLRVEVYTTDNNADYVKFKGEKAGSYNGNLLTVYDGDAADACSQSGLICAEYSIAGDVDWVRPVVADDQAEWKAWLQPWYVGYH